MPEPSCAAPIPRAELTEVPEAAAARPAARVARIAGRQWGVVSRAQLERCGLTGSTISRWVAEGRIHRLHRGVYAVGHDSLGPEGRLAAAMIRVGPGAALSHLTAAWWWRLIRHQPSEIHLSTPRQVKAPTGIHVHPGCRAERAWHRGLPVTGVAQTLLDCAAMMPSADLRRALAEAEYLRLVDLGALTSSLGRGRPGSAAMRAALARHRPQLARTRSVLEERFLDLCEKHRLPLPEVNARVAGLIVDAFWSEARLVVELDGHAAHGSRAAIERDRRRELVLRRAGHGVLRYTWEQVTREPGPVVADLRAALGAG